MNQIDDNRGEGALQQAARATHEQSRQAVSAVPVGIANAFILERHTGSYEDYRTTPILVFLDEKQAKNIASEARAEFEMAKELVPSRKYPEEPHENEAAWDAWEAAREADWARFKGYLTIDPSMAPSGAWSEPEEDIAYHVVAVPFAQGMETRQGGDGTAPSQDDSPVACDAPNPPQGGHNEGTH